MIEYIIQFTAAFFFNSIKSNLMHIPSIHDFIEVEFDAEKVHRHRAPNKMI